MAAAARLGSRLRAWAPGPALCLSTTLEVPDAEWQGLGSGELFVPLWQMVDVGSRRNRPKIVPATQTFRRHQCTPLCNNTNFVAAEKSIFFPLEKSSCGERLLWLPAAPRLPPLSLLPTPDRSALLGRFAFSLTLGLGQSPGLPFAPLRFVIPRFWVLGCVQTRGGGEGGEGWGWERDCRSPPRGHLQPLGQSWNGSESSLSSGYWEWRGGRGHSLPNLSRQTDAANPSAL